MVVLGGPVFRPDAAHFVFRLGEVVERQHIGQFAEAFVDREDGIVEVEEVRRRALVFDVRRGLDVVQAVDKVEACSVVRFEVSPQVVLRMEEWGLGADEEGRRKGGMRDEHMTFLKCYGHVLVSRCCGSDGRDPVYLTIGRSTVKT